MKKRMSILIALIMLLVIVVPVQAKPNLSKDLWVVGVKEDESVTLRFDNYPAHETYYVLMNYNGTLGINGYLSSKLTTNSGGDFYAEFPIPEELMGEEIINFRVVNIDGESDPPFDYFYNEESAFNPYLYKGTSSSSSSDTTYNHLENGFPTATVVSVNAGSAITVKTVNFPGDVRWAVYMKDGAMAATTWYEVSGFNSISGTQTMTLSIPSDLKFKDKVAVKFYCLDYVLGTNDFSTYILVDNRNYP